VKAVQPVRIHTLWDPEARVWVAESPDVPGLVTEAETLEALVEKLRALIPELWELNRGPLPPQALTIRLEAEFALASW